MSSRTLLVGTTNQGKLNEIRAFFEDLPFKLLSLSDLKKEIAPPDEDGDTIEANAIAKAKYYAAKADLLVIADDCGLFIEALDGYPGVKADRAFGGRDGDRVGAVLAEMKNTKNRAAAFRAALTVYDPADETYFVSTGELKGEISDTVSKAKKTAGWGYNKVFYVPEMDKTYSELTISEKNSISHRGKALTRTKYYLRDRYCTKHIVVPVGLIIRDGKVLLNKRSDPFREEYHGRWETPGGSVEYGETIEECLKREVREESGYEVKIIKRIGGIGQHEKKGQNYSYQVYFLPYVCEIIGGDGNYNDHEVMEANWFKPEDILELDLVPGGKDFFKQSLPELKKIIMRKL